MLTYETAFPESPRDGAPLVVLLHGRGADSSDLLGLRPYLPDEWLLVAPRAPFPGMPWGYGPGWAWYLYLEGDRPEPESFRESQSSLDRFLEALPDRLPVRPGPLVLGGFSQGGTMAIANALRRRDRVPLVINFSGFLADHPDVRVDGGSVAGTAFFWGHGTHDPAIPFSLAVNGRAALEAAGADLEARDYPIAHGISPDELRDAVSWLHGRIQARS